MAILTPLSIDEARVLGNHYGLEVDDVRGIRTGSVNSNFELATHSGRVFLRIYEEQTADAAAREAALLTYLAGAGVPTPEPLRRVDGSGFISISSGKPVSLFPFRDGEMVCQKSVTETKTHAVGVALGHIHHAGSVLGAARLGGLAGESRFGREALRARLVRIGEMTTDREILQVRDELERFLREPCDEPQALGLIHGDVFRDNVLWQNDRIAAVLDFESASIGSLAFDLIVTVLAWCFASELQQPLARALVAGYRESAPLDRGLTSELFDAGRFACARFTTTRITDFELRPRGATVYKDFRRWKRRMEQLEALGPGGLSTMLDLA